MRSLPKISLAIPTNSEVIPTNQPTSFCVCVRNPHLEAMLKLKPEDLARHVDVTHAAANAAGAEREAACAVFETASLDCISASHKLLSLLNELRATLDAIRAALTPIVTLR